LEHFLPYFKANRAVFGRRSEYKYSLYLVQFIGVVVIIDADDDNGGMAGV